MARQWTLEERQRQAQLIKAWKPWETSTGPVTTEGKQVSRTNSTKHGLRSAYFLEAQKLLGLLRQRERTIKKAMAEVPEIEI